MTPTDTVLRFLAALEALDAEGCLALLDEDVVYHNVGLPPAVGKTAVRKQLEAFSRHFDGFRVEMKNLAANGPVVLTERVDIIEARGLRLDPWVCGTFEVRDGRITLWRDYFDWAQMTGQVLKGLPAALLSLGRRRRRPS